MSLNFATSINSVPNVLQSFLFYIVSYGLYYGFNLWLFKMWKYNKIVLKLLSLVNNNINNINFKTFYFPFIGKKSIEKNDKWSKTKSLSFKTINLIRVIYRMIDS